MTLDRTITRGNVAALGAVACLAGFMYVKTFAALLSTWKDNEDYSHGFFIIPIAAYLVWKKRGAIAMAASHKTAIGWVLLGAWALCYAAGVIGNIVTLTNISFVLLPIAATAVVLGAASARYVVVPSIFMLFMFPVPSEIYTRVTNPLLLLSTTASFHILSFLGLPVLQEGNLLTLPGYTMEVVRACSGIRSLVTIMALAYLMAALMLKGVFQGVLLLAASIPTAIFGNILRITSTAVLAYHVSPRAAEGFSHTLAGLATFVLSFVILSCFMVLIRWISERNGPSS